MGPVISERAVTRIASTIERASSSGAGELIVGGERVDRPGFFIHPALFAGVASDSSLAQDEVFGPVLATTSFEDEDEAIDLANGTRYGLAAYLHTSDVARAHRVAARLDAGSVGVNGGTGLAGPLGPFGGFKQSGHGKEGGTEGVQEYLRTKNVNLRLG
jgi:acyl-CoA reductase-like NAD-dependent aldehyde dehydrogenase